MISLMNKKRDTTSLIIPLTEINNLVNVGPHILTLDASFIPTKGNTSILNCHHV